MVQAEDFGTFQKDASVIHFLETNHAAAPSYVTNYMMVNGDMF